MVNTGRPYKDPTEAAVVGAAMEGVYDPSLLVEDSWTKEQQQKWIRLFNVHKKALQAREADAQDESFTRDVKALRASQEHIPVVSELARGVDLARQRIASLGHRAYSLVDEPEHGQDSLADVANRRADEQADVYARGDTRMWGLGTLQKGLRGAAESVGQAAVLGPLGSKGVTLGFALSEGNQAQTEGQDAGLTGSELRSHVAKSALIEGGVATVFAMAGKALARSGVGKSVLGAGLGGFEAMAGGELAGASTKQMLANVVAELFEENATEILHAYNKADAGLTPDVTPEQRMEIYKDTTVQTLLTLGLGHGVNRAKALLSKPEILAGWAMQNPDAARTLLASDDPASRGAFNAAGLPHAPREVRDKAVAAIQGAVDVLDGPPTQESGLSLPPEIVEASTEAPPPPTPTPSPVSRPPTVEEKALAEAEAAKVTGPEAQPATVAGSPDEDLLGVDFGEIPPAKGWRIGQKKPTPPPSAPAEPPQPPSQVVQPSAPPEAKPAKKGQKKPKPKPAPKPPKPPVQGAERIVPLDNRKERQDRDAIEARNAEAVKPKRGRDVLQEETLALDADDESLLESGDGDRVARREGAKASAAHLGSHKRGRQRQEVLRAIRKRWSKGAEFTAGQIKAEYGPTLEREFNQALPDFLAGATPILKKAGQKKGGKPQRYTLTEHGELTELGARLLLIDAKADAAERAAIEQVEREEEEAGKLDDFARDVAAVARESQTGRFGDNKVFISHALAAYRKKHGEISEERFKARLVEANRKGFLQLARADLVEAMDKNDVASSETAVGMARFHFVDVTEAAVEEDDEVPFFPAKPASQAAAPTAAPKPAAKSAREAQVEDADDTRPHSPATATAAPSPAPAEAKPTGGVQVSEVVDLVKDQWGVEVRGPATFKKKFKRERALAWYEAALGLIRAGDIQNVEKVTALMHELGHHVDREFESWKKRWSKQKHVPPEIDAELKKLGEDLYGPGNKGDPFYKAEGFAEFVREYVTGSDTIATRAPHVYAWFTNEFLGQNAEEAAKFKKLSDKVLQFLSQRPADAIKVALEPPRKDWSLSRMLAEAQAWLDNKVRDSLFPILRALQETGIYEPGKLLWHKDPFALASTFSGNAGARAAYIALQGHMDLWGRPIKGAKSVKETLLPITSQGKEQYREWLEYFVAAVGLQRMNQKGKDATGRDAYNPGFTREVAEAIVKEREVRPAYKETAEAFTKLAHLALRPLVESGFWTEALYQKVVDSNLLYLPLMRHVEAEGGRLGGKNPIYQTTKAGGHQSIQDPMDSFMLQIGKIHQTAMQHAVWRSIVDFYDDNKKAAEGGTFLSKLVAEIPAPTEARTFGAEQIDDVLKGVLEKAGVTDDEAKKAIDEYWNAAIGPLEERTITVFSQGKEYKGALPFTDKNGKARFFEMTPDLKNVLEAISFKPWLGGELGEAIRAVNKLQKTGIIGLNPRFGMVTNFIRDQITAWIFSDYSTQIPFWTSFQEAMRGTFRATNEARQRYEASGAPVSAFGGTDTSNAQDLAVQATGYGATVGQRVRSAAHSLAEFLSQTEAWPRIVEQRAAYDHEYKKRIAEGKTPEEADLSATILSTIAGKDNTVNFKKGGSLTRKIAEIVFFAGASVSSADKAARSFGLAEPMPWATIQTRGGNFARSSKRALGLTATALAIYLYFNKGDPDWEELEPHQKWGYMNIKIGPKRFLSIPLPFEAGAVFGAFPVATLEASVGKDKKALAEAFKIALKNASPVDGVGPDGVNLHELARNVGFMAPIIDVLANKDWKGQAINPQSMQDHLIASQQHGPRASYLAKQLGWLVNASPAEIDYLLNGFTGGLYRRVFGYFDGSEGFRKDEPATYPLVGALIKRPGAGSRLAGDFYDRLRELRQKRGSKVATLEELGELASAEQVNEDLTEKWKKRRAAGDSEAADSLLVEAQDMIRVHNKRDAKKDRVAGLGSLLFRHTDPSGQEKDLQPIPKGITEAEALEALQAEALRRAEAERDSERKRGRKVQPIGHYVRARDDSGNWTAYGKRRARLMKLLRGEKD